MSDTSIRLPELPARRRGGGKNYDWSTWFDGDTHLLLRGRHFEVASESMRAMAHKYAKSIGVPITTRLIAAGTLDIFDDLRNPVHLNDEGLGLQATREPW